MGSYLGGSGQNFPDATGAGFCFNTFLPRIGLFAGSIEGYGRGVGLGVGENFHNPTIMLQYVLPTFFDRRVKKSAEILAQLEAYCGDKLCPPIRYNVRLSEAPGHSQTIFEYAPRSAGAQDYQKLTERIQNGGA